MEKDQDISENNSTVRAFQIWKSGYGSVQIDSQIKLVLDKAVDAYSCGRLRLTRKALLLSVNEMARRLEISSSSYCDLEKNDDKGHIKLSSLARAAEAEVYSIHLHVYVWGVSTPLESSPKLYVLL